MSSIAGRVALPLYGPYAASKFALEALSDSLRREQTDVKVVLVEPGAIATPIWKRGIEAGDALWNAMPPRAHERYAKLVDTIRKEAEKQATEGDPPEAVARVIATALTTPATPARATSSGATHASRRSSAERCRPKAIDKLLARLLNN